MTTVITFTRRKASAPGTWGGQSWMGGTFSGDGYDIRFRYNPEVVELLKSVIPGNCRIWDAAGKLWFADVHWSKVFADACRQEGHKIIGLNGGGPSSPPKLPPPPPAPAISWADVLLARCPTVELREKVYKQLAKALHADLGGNDQLMQELNDARNSYRQEGTA